VFVYSQIQHQVFFFSYFYQVQGLVLEKSLTFLGLAGLFHLGLWVLDLALRGFDSVVLDWCSIFGRRFQFWCFPYIFYFPCSPVKKQTQRNRDEAELRRERKQDEDQSSGNSVNSSKTISITRLKTVTFLSLLSLKSQRRKFCSSHLSLYLISVTTHCSGLTGCGNSQHLFVRVIPLPLIDDISS